MRIVLGFLIPGIFGLAACGDDGSGTNRGTRVNIPPTAAFTAACTGLTCTLTDRSTDPDGSIQAHAWEFGDGGTSTETSPTHDYAVAGTFTARLTVTDDGGDTGTFARELTVESTEPLPAISGTYERETPHGSSDRHSRYLLHEDGQFEFYDIRGSDDVVYMGRWALYDADTPWIDLDFDDFAGGDCAIPGHPFQLEGIGVLFEISGATYLSISYCGFWYLDDRQDGDYLEEGIYASDGAGDDPGTTPPLAGEIAFVREGRIHLVATDGTGAVPVSDGPGDAEPAWSPDGQRIAFTRLEGPAPGIYVIEADGSDPVRRTTSGRFPAWSPDGQSLAFTCTEQAYRLCSIDVEGNAAPVVVWPPAPPARTSHPAWSPDGSRIAFTSDFSGYDTFFDIFVVAPDGSGLTNLTSGIHRPHVIEFYQPARSQDGEHIAFTSCPWAFEFCSSSVVSLMRADGTGLEWLAAANGFARPTWSPDGQLIAFASENAIKWVRADGSDRGRLVVDGSDPAWRP